VSAKYHPGEIEVQEHAGVRSMAERVAWARSLSRSRGFCKGPSRRKPIDAGSVAMVTAMTMSYGLFLETAAVLLFQDAGLSPAREEQDLKEGW
jgi:hypothetical protein